MYLSNGAVFIMKYMQVIVVYIVKCIQACGTYVGEERCVQVFTGDIRGKETTWKT
jgi:hypothetical protein